MNSTSFRRSLFTSSLFMMTLVLALTLLVVNLSLRNFIFQQSKTQIAADFETIKVIIKDQIAEVDATQANSLIKSTYEALNLALRISTQASSHSSFIALNGQNEVTFPKDLSKVPLQSGDLILLQAKVANLTEGELSLVRLDGHRYMVSVHNLARTNKANPNAKLKLVLMASLSDSDALISRINRLFIIIFALSLFISGGYATLLAKRLYTPLKQVVDHAIAIGQGSTAQIVEKSHFIEFNSLYASLNAMTQSLSRKSDDQLQYFQNLSHDLRTPLMSIQGYAEGIQEGIFDDPISPASIIAEESLRLKKLVDQLLTLSRLESSSGLVQTTIESLNLKDQLDHCRTRIKSIADAKQIHITLNCDQSIQIMSDEVLFQTIIINLLANAVRYAQKIVVIDVFTNNKGTLSIDIQDDGPGIDPHIQEQLFMRNKKGKDGEFGLGLSIVKLACEKIHAQIEGNNNNVGAKFTVTL